MFSVGDVELRMFVVEEFTQFCSSFVFDANQSHLPRDGFEGVISEILFSVQKVLHSTIEWMSLTIAGFKVCISRHSVTFAVHFEIMRALEVATWPNL